MSRHAYLIIAHNEPGLLKRLVARLDDERNDIFIHIDAKSDINAFGGIACRRSALCWIPRRSVIWGALSQVRVEMDLLKFAHEKGPYARYHLISGVDLVLKTQDEIHRFCDEIYPEKEFIGFRTDESSRRKARKFSEYRYFFGEWIRVKGSIWSRPLWILRKLAFKIQKGLKLRRSFDVEIWSGPNWFSVTDRVVQLILEKEAWIYQTFKWANCPDELFMQTVVWNSPLKDHLFDLTDPKRGAMRAIDWTRGDPYVWQPSDYEELRASDRLFARKISYAGIELVNRIYGFEK